MAKPVRLGVSLPQVERRWAETGHRAEGTSSGRDAREGAGLVAERIVPARRA